MTGFGNPQPGWVDRLKSELLRDKKKAVILGVLVLVGAILGVRAICVSAGSSPANAEGAVATSGAMPGVASDGSAAAAAPGAPNPRNLRDVRARGTITRDLFTPKLDGFPLVQQPKPTPVVTVATTQPVDAEEIRAAGIRDAAGGLLLQSTIISSGVPKAIINGQVVGLKDVIQGFEVVEVTAGACVVQQAGVRISLEIRQQ